MKRIIYIIGLLIGWSTSSAWAQTEGYNPSNPPNPESNIGYRLTLEAVPNGSCYLYQPSGKFAVGQEVQVGMYEYSNFEFVAWVEDTDTISKQTWFTYKMPNRNVHLKAILRYNPYNPGNPESELTKYKLELRSKPVGACSFNYAADNKWHVGTELQLGFSEHPNFVFRCWEDEAGNTLTTDRYLPFTMPNSNVRLYAVFDYSPNNPDNPGKNDWDVTTGSVIVDDFVAGNLNAAIEQVIGGWNNCSEVSQIVVAGKISSNDMNIIWNYPNCTMFDLSRTTGASQVPYWCFENRTQLTHVLLPASIHQLSSYSFYGCSALQALTCYAMTPPQVDASAFEGVSADLVVYVPASALPLYQEAEVWKNFIILPIKADVQNLEVNLPESCSDGRYKNLTLELLNLKSAQKIKYIVSDRLNYQFNNLIKNTCYRASLKNAYGSVISQIDSIWIQDEDVSVTFSELKPLRNVAVKVTDRGGKPLRESVDVTWSSADGTYLGKGKSLSGLVEGFQLTCSFALPQRLSVEYELPADTTFCVLSGENVIELELVPLRKVTLQGRVLDVQNGRPVPHAVVSVAQMIHGLYAKTTTAKVDLRGNYRVEVFAVPSTITFGQSEYISQEIELTDSMLAADVVQIEDVSLKSIVGATIDIHFTHTKSAKRGTESHRTDYYDDYNNVSYSIYNKTQLKPIEKFVVQYPRIVLLEEVNVLDELEITATSRNSSFKAVTETTKLKRNNTASITFNLKQLGAIYAAYTQTENAAVVGMLYDAHGQFVKKFDYKADTLNLAELPDARYTLITMGRSQLFNAMFTLKAFDDARMKEGVDYLKDDVNVESGVIASVKNHLIPFFDETKFYYTGAGTNFSVNKASVVVGNYLTLQANLDFKEAFNGSISQAEIVFELPESCSFVDNSMMIGSKMASYQKEGNYIVVALEENEKVSADRVRFCMVPTESGNFAPNAYVRFVTGGRTIMQPIGNAQFEAKGLSISTPSVVAQSAFVVNGSSTPNSSVMIYDQDILIGQTTSLANGVWSTTCMLNNPVNLSVHPIHAKVTSKEGLALESETKNCLYNRNAIEVKSISMSFYNAWMRQTVSMEWDFETTTTDKNAYSFYAGTDFTFVFDLTNNDSTAVNGVDLYVHTESGGVKKLEATYNKRLGRWIAAGFFDYGTLPVNLSCELLTNAPIVIENEVLIEQESEVISLLANAIHAELPGETYTVLTDEEEHLTFNLSTPESEEPLTFDIEQLNFEEARAMLATTQFDFYEVEEGEGYTCYKIDELSNGVVVTLVSLPHELAFKMTMTRGEEVAAARKKGVIDASIKAMRRFWKSGDAAEALEDLADGALDIAGVKKYLGVPNFEHWMDLYDMYSDDLSKYGSLVTKLTTAKCPDGSLKMTKEQRDEFMKRWAQLDQSVVDYFNAFGDYLEQYNQKLKNSLFYDASLGLLFKGASAAGKGALKGGKILTNSKNAKYFQYNIPASILPPAKRKWLSAATGMAFTAAEAGVEKIVNPDFADFNGVEDEMDKFVTSHYENIRDAYNDLIRDIKGAHKKCGNNDEPVETSPTPPFTPVRPIIDPSGYVYEAVHSNRIEGVTATCYYKETVEDIYGDLHEEVVLWNAEEYAQKNPLFTDEFGMYSWDVPQGLWQVKFEKEGYQTTYSDWLPVPPPQMDVNIGMLQNSQPEIMSAKAYSDGVELEFSKYMKPETFTVENVYIKTIVDEEETLLEDVSIDFPDAEQVSEEDSTIFTTKVAIRTNTDLSLADEVFVVVSNQVESYAGVQMGNDFVQKLDVEKKIQQIAVDSVLYVAYEETKSIQIGVLPAEASKGKTLKVRSLSDMIATVTSNEVLVDANGYTLLTIDENGQATFTLSGELLGTTALELGIVDEVLQQTALISVVEPVKLGEVKDATASLVSGSSLYRGQTVSLSCETEGASIYYTLDGTCPCENTSIKYEGRPITINGKTTLKVMAVGLNGSESNVREYVYTIRQTQQQIQMKQGWNWSSHSVAGVLSSEVFEKDFVQRILTQTGELYNDVELGFVGNLTNIAAYESFKVKSQKDFNIQLSGELYNPNSYVIQLHEGWNWLGYPIEQTMALHEALAHLEAEEADVISTLDGGFAQYTDGEWKGTLQTLEHGEGYLYKSQSDKSFVYNDMFVSNAQSLYGHRMETDKAPWEVDVHAHPNMMCVVAQLYAENEPTSEDEYYVAAFADNSCRGVGKYVDGVVYLPVYGSTNEEIYFLAMNRITKEVFAVQEKLPFVPDVAGTHNAPTALNLGEATAVDSIKLVSAPSGIYNMQGQKLLRITRNGLYIIDGKKVLINNMH